MTDGGHHTADLSFLALANDQFQFARIAARTKLRHTLGPEAFTFANNPVEQSRRRFFPPYAGNLYAVFLWPFIAGMRQLQAKTAVILVSKSNPSESASRRPTV